MKPIRDAWSWTVKKVGDHPAAAVGAAVGGFIGSVAGPVGTVAGAAAGASLGNHFDQPRPDGKK